MSFLAFTPLRLRRQIGFVVKTTAMPSSIQRAPIPALRPFIQFLWASCHQSMPEGLMLAVRERMIPSACMHVVFRFSDQPIRIFKSIEDTQGDTFDRGAVAGV